MPSTDVILFHLFSGLVWGCIVALIALGLSLIFGIMGIINMAHGDLFMLGAVVTVVVVAHLGSIWYALVLAPLLIAAAAMPVERLVLRPLEGRPLATMVGTLGLSYIIQQTVLITWGGSYAFVLAPVTFVVPIGGVAFPGYRLVAAGIGVAFIAGLWLLIYRTRFGLLLRATIDQPDIAGTVGINTNWLRAASFGLGAGLAGVAGVLAAPIQNVFYLMGGDVLLLAFVVVIIGGLGNLAGTLVMAIAISVIQGLLGAFVQPVESELIVFALLAAIVIVRPNGLFRARVAAAS